jgi:hypothetical protein
LLWVEGDLYRPAVFRLVSLSALVCGCSFTPPTPVAYVAHGPAFGQPVTPLAAMPVNCDAMTLGCLPGYQLAVANATRMAIEFGGYSLVDSELINAEMRVRFTRTRQDLGTASTATLTNGTITGTTGTTETTTEVTGRTWIDLGAAERRDLLKDIGIRGLLYSTIGLGVPHGMAGQRTVTVRIALARLADDAVVWQSECGVETGDFHSEAQALELATKCALESGTLW